MLSEARRLGASDKRARWGAESCYSLERLNYLSSLGDTRGGIRNHSSPKIILAVREIEGKSFFSCYLRVVGADSRRRGMRRGPAGGATLATSRLVAPPRLVGLEPTGHLPQVGEAMRPRSEVGSLHVAASDADGGGADGLGRGRTSSDAVCM